MVGFRTCVLTFLLLFYAAVYSGEPEIFVDIDQTRMSENKPVDVFVTISRDRELQVDESTFELGGMPIKVDLLGNSTRNSISIMNGKRTQENLVISKYRFQVEGMDAGIHLLPSVKVKIGDRTYTSNQISFELESPQNNTSKFRIERSFEGAIPLFPGQRFKFIYRIYFAENIDLSRQDLYLLDAKEFMKIGEMKERRWKRSGGFVHELSQEYQAIESGVFNFPASVIEGFSYRQDLFGRRSYIKPRLRAEASPLTITVDSFPTKGQPSSFDGALGDFAFDVEMLTSEVVSVGDKIELQVDIGGRGELSTVKLPSISCQPGFNVNYRFSDLPPTGEEIVSQRGPSKRYILEIRPLSSQITEVPEIEFSSFDPVTKEYVVKRSKPFTITVESLKSPPKWEREEKEVPEVVEEPPKEIEKPDWNEVLGTVGAIEILGNVELDADDLEESLVTSIKVFYLIPFGVFLLLLQIGVKLYYGRKETRQKQKKSQKFLSKLEKARSVDECYRLLKQALILRLVEKELLKEEVASWRDLSNEGVEGEVRAFLEEIEKKHYSGSEEISQDQLVSDGKKLFNKI